MELKKSYKGFVLWIVGFIVAMFGTAFLPVENGAVLMRVTMNVCVMGIALLAYIIYKTEYVYWYNGTEYEDAVKAGSERRKAFGWKHFVHFAVFAVLYLVYSVLAHFWGIHKAVDVVVATLGLVGVAVSTVWIKL